MEEEKRYNIYTDASFDDITKLGTYAIVIMQENKLLKVISGFQEILIKQLISILIQLSKN